MSSLLKEAIVDAKALKEAALKNAESTIIDKYSDEVKQMVENILEQEDELALDAPDETGAADNAVAQEVTETDIPLASTNDLGDQEGAGLADMPNSSDEIALDIDLSVLEEAIASLEDELNEEEEQLDEGETETDEINEDEEIELSEEAIASLLETEDEELNEEEEQIDEE